MCYFVSFFLPTEVLSMVTIGKKKMMEPVFFVGEGRGQLGGEIDCCFFSSTGLKLADLPISTWLNRMHLKSVKKKNAQCILLKKIFFKVTDKRSCWRKEVKYIQQGVQDEFLLQHAHASALTPFSHTSKKSWNRVPQNYFFFFCL